MATTNPADHWQAAVAAALAGLTAADRRRTLAPRAFGPEAAPDGLLDLTHNDYLGLRADRDFQARVHRATAGLPVGAGGSRLLGGEHPVFAALEQEFAAFKGAPSALYFASGYAANEGVAAALARLPGVAFFSDALNHASLIDGIRLGGLPRERRIIYRHNDAGDLERHLRASTAPLNCIFTESVFSMDGDTADLAALGALARRYRGLLVVDEAHAILCLGDGGQGLAKTSGLAEGELITVDTCGKAMGVQGAFVAAPVWFRDYLINVARPFIFSTAPSPWLAQALRETVAYAPALAPRRADLAAAAKAVRAGLADAGWSTGASTTHILPVRVPGGTDGGALRLAAGLRENGILARAIRPPTVPEGQARVRLSLNATVDEAAVRTLLSAFRAVGTL